MKLDRLVTVLTAVSLMCLAPVVSGHAAWSQSLSSDPGSAIPTFGDSIAADMEGLNDGRPHGVPDGWDWADGPIIHAGHEVDGRQVVTAWGQIHEAADGNWNRRVRIEIRDLAGWMLRRSTDDWVLLKRSSSITGAYYREDFSGNDNWPVDVVPLEAGGVSVRPVTGRCYHFYWRGRVKIDTAEVAGFVFWFEARLVPADPREPGEVNGARYVASVGADYYSTMSSADPAAIAHGKTKYLTPQWQRFFMTTLPRTRLRQNPPPSP